MTGTRKRPKRANGEGSFTVDAKGRHVGRATINGKRVAVYARTRVDAMAKLNRLRVDAERGVQRVDGNATVQPMLDRWRQRVLPGKRVRGEPLSPSSRENYQMALRVLGQEFGHDRLAKLTKARVEAGLDRIASGVYGRGKPLGARSMKLYRDTFVQVLDEAADEIPRNYAKLAKPPVTPPSTHRPSAMSAPDVMKLWAVLDRSPVGAAFKLMITTTLRPGEALGICWDSIDLDTGELTLRRGVRREKGKATLVPTLKTTNAQRSLIIPAPALEAVRAQRRRVAEMKLAAKNWPDPDPGLVTPTVNGGPWDASNMREELTNLCELAGVPRVRPNELRHTAKAVLDDERIDPVVIRNLMGHSNEWMQDAYGNRARRAEDGHVEVMNKMFGS